MKAVADKGYYSGREILLCDSIGVSAYVSKPLTSANTARGLYGKERFAYDAREDRYLCPAGQELTYRFSTNEKGRPIRYSPGAGLQDLPAAESVFAQPGQPDDHAAGV